MEGDIWQGREGEGWLSKGGEKRRAMMHGVLHGGRHLGRMVGETLQSLQSLSKTRVCNKVSPSKTTRTLPGAVPPVVSARHEDTTHPERQAAKPSAQRDTQPLQASAPRAAAAAAHARPCRAAPVRPLPLPLGCPC